jgi:hypothetical protein
MESASRPPASSSPQTVECRLFNQTNCNKEPQAPNAAD